MAALQLRRGTADRLEQVNPLLLAGEPCVETDTHKLKIGDGKTRWHDLPYVGNESDISFIAADEALPDFGQANRLYIKNKVIYQFNADKGEYEPLNSGGSSFDPNEIKLINGGTANG